MVATIKEYRSDNTAYEAIFLQDISLIKKEGQKLIPASAILTFTMKSTTDKDLKN